MKTTARRATRTVTRTVGRWTAGTRMLPGFLIVGGQRCGTTSLYKTLSQHQCVLPAVFHKGVHYFDVAYDRGFSWYRGHFPTMRRASAVRQEHGAAITGESSPYYMVHPLAAQRIAADLPEVKLLVLLRDPVERAYSAHAHELARGFETEASFERALALEDSRVAGEAERMVADPAYNSHHFQHNAYVSRGQYVDHLARLEAIVGRERIHVVDSGDFFTDPEPSYNAVTDFLGLPRATGIVFGKHNARSRSPMDESLRARLEEHFAPYDDRLADWWGRTPSWRR